MKKRLLLTGASLLLVILFISGGFWGVSAIRMKHYQAQGVVAVVYGETITQDYLDEQVANSKLSYENGVRDIEAADLPEAERQERLADLKPVKTKEQVLQNTIRNLAAYHEAKRLGLQAKLEEGQQAAKENYGLLQELAANNEGDKNAATYQWLQSYLKEKGWSEEDYLTQSALSYQRSISIDNLFQYFKDELYSSEKAVSLQDQFDLYVDQLAANAKIKYIS